MDDWEFDAFWEWEDEEDHQDFLFATAAELAELYFLSDNAFTFLNRDDYDLGFLSPESWWPLVNQLDKLVDLELLVELSYTLDKHLDLDGLPSEVLEAPLVFLESCLGGNLPRESTGRRVGSPKLVKIALVMTQLLQAFPATGQAAVRAWADVHRQMMGAFALDDADFDDMDGFDLADLLFAPNMPPALTGFSMMIALTLARWPERAEGLPLPPEFFTSDLYDQVLEEWESLPSSPPVTEEGVGEAEAFFAQGQLAHLLAQMGTVELMNAGEEDADGEDLALAYSRLSRAVLWLHDQCRHCPERDDVTCKVAVGGPVLPMPLLDVAGEIANTGRIVGCVKM